MLQKRKFEKKLLGGPTPSAKHLPKLKSTPCNGLKQTKYTILLTSKIVCCKKTKIEKKLLGVGSHPSAKHLPKLKWTPCNGLKQTKYSIFINRNNDDCGA